VPLTLECTPGCIVEWMDDCCSAPRVPVAGADALCRQCASKGARVALLTVKSLLTAIALARMTPALPFYVCLEPTCPVVYFTNEGLEYTRTDVRAVPWQKEPIGHRRFCHCFDENEPSMLRELAETGRCDAVQRVRDLIVADRCACEVRNPRGTCCLGDVMKAVDGIEAGRLSEHQT
jgi:hypothetical protein